VTLPLHIDDSVTYSYLLSVPPCCQDQLPVMVRRINLGIWGEWLTPSLPWLNLTTSHSLAVPLEWPHCSTSWSLHLGSPYVTSPRFNPLAYQLKWHSVIPSCQYMPSTLFPPRMLVAWEGNEFQKKYWPQCGILRKLAKINLDFWVLTDVRCDPGNIKKSKLSRNMKPYLHSVSPLTSGGIIVYSHPDYELIYHTVHSV
jgi:hypothetical protein